MSLYKKTEKDFLHTSCKRIKQRQTRPYVVGLRTNTLEGAAAEVGLSIFNFLFGVLLPFLKFLFTATLNRLKKHGLVCPT